MRSTELFNYRLRRDPFGFDFIGAAFLATNFKCAESITSRNAGPVDLALVGAIYPIELFRFLSSLTAHAYVTRHFAGH